MLICNKIKKLSGGFLVEIIDKPSNYKCLETIVSSFKELVELLQECAWEEGDAYYKLINEKPRE